jgi:hypothetical protein
MNNIRRGLLVLLCFIAVASCQKDDICVEGDTPLMVVEFFNIADPDALKNVTALRVVGEGQTLTVNTVADRSNLNTITIPLKTAEDITSFLLISNSASDDNGAETGNVDTVNFSYSRLEDFKSRACGFVINYDNLSAELQTDTDNWIQDIEITQTRIINADSTHVKIFH